jgi:hypothetical protein
MERGNQLVKFVEAADFANNTEDRRINAESVVVMEYALTGDRRANANFVLETLISLIFKRIPLDLN